MNQPVDGMTVGLEDRTRLLLLEAFATFGKPGDDPYEVARAISTHAKMAGFTKAGRRRLLESAYDLADECLRTGDYPVVDGMSSPNIRLLFGRGGLGGLFDPDQRQTQLKFDSDEEARDRALIEQLIAATRLYASSTAIKELLDFTVRLRAFAPFNAMLLHIQKPGLTHAATAADWGQRFGRVPKEGARPLIVLRVMGPVDFVFDVLDTHGRDLPDQAFTFPTLGNISQERFQAITARVARSGIELRRLDAGDAQAGWIRRLPAPLVETAKQRYELAVNANHPRPTQLVTIAHELAHLYLGHLGDDKKRDIRDRRDRTHAQREVEAEMTAYLVAKRNGLTPRSESYLDSYKEAFTGIDLYGVMRAANAVEAVMGVSAHILWQAKR
jgi:hypothetical protein